jgi:hypothetical protein
MSTTTPSAPPSFWSIIDAARAAAPEDVEAFAEAVRAELAKLPAAEIIAFQRDLDVLMDRLFHWDLWGAAFIMNFGCSDDGFEYWRGWLIAQGQQTCEAAMANAESLAAASVRYGEPGQYECESLLYMPAEALDEQSEDEMPRIGNRPTEPAGEMWEEDGDDLKTRFPKLWKRFSE